MKKYILSLFMVLGLFVLSGCGGSDNVSNSDVVNPDVTGDTAVQIQLNEIATTEDTFNLEAIVTKQIDSSYAIELSDFSVISVGCSQAETVFTPNVLSLNSGVGSSAAVYINGKYDQNCSTTQYILSMNQKTTKDGAVDSRMISVTYNVDNPGGGITPTPSSGFFNATTPLEITAADTPYDVKVQVLEDGYVAAGKIVKMKPFESKYGSIVNYEAVTGADGWAIFKYTSPSQDIFPETGVSTTLQLTLDDNGTILVQDIVLDFNNTGTILPPVDTSKMRMYAVPTEMDITTAGESRTVSMYLENTDTNAPIEGVAVKANFFDPANGTLNVYEAVTNANGQAVFNYTAPETLPAGSFQITFDVANATASIAQNVTVNFVGNTPPVDTSKMRMYAVPTEVNITTAGESRTLSVYLENTDTNAPIEGVTLKANFFDPANGTLNVYEAVTNANGQAVFNYTAPVILPIGSFQIIFDVANATASIAQNVTVNFDLASYIITPEQNITVSDLSQTQTIKVALSRKPLNQPLEPAVGKTVVAEFLMPLYGSLVKYEAVVDESGVATFEYISPNRSIDVNDTNITFYYKDNHTVTGKTELIFQVPNVDKVERLYVVPDSFTITDANETKKITIITVNAQNIGISSTVEVEQPNNGTDYGYFTPSGPVTTDSSGRAEILYTAPSAISGLSERNITFTETSQNISQELNMKFEQGTGPGVNYEIAVTVPRAFEVDSNDQITVRIQEVGNVNNIIADENVYEVNLTSQFTNMLTFEGGSATYTYAQKGVKAVYVETKTLSGTAVVEVNASIFNGDQNVTISTLVPVVILSGPVDAMSLVYAGTDEDTNLGLYKNYYTIHAVDRYNNPAQEGITLHPSIINGTKVVRTFAGQNTGEIIQKGTPDEFKDATVNIFSTVDTNDILTIITNPDRLNNAYLGNWSIADVLDSNTLELAEDYLDVTTDSLNYVIGNASRYIDGYGIATVDIKDNGNGYVTDANGNVQFEVTFDPILAGHTVTISANAYDENRTGAAIVAGLRWGDYDSTVVTIPNDGDDHNVTLALSISNGLEPLVGVDIVPDSILSSNSGCDLNSSAVSDLHTDSNGRITVQISTGIPPSTALECDISWRATQSGIYREY